MTYNIRSCRGSDGRLDLDRVAEVIASFDPHLVGLQEVDRGRSRSRGCDQAAALADRLGMAVRFACTIDRGGELTGNATLTRLPVLAWREVRLPHSGRGFMSEPRCALVARLAWPAAAGSGPARPLAFVNTHLSTIRREQPAQVTALSCALDGEEDAVVVGDLNCTPRSGNYRTLCARLRAASRGARTWPALLPFMQLDHILFRGRLEVVRGGVWANRLARRASDHLPVVAELAARAPAGTIACLPRAGVEGCWHGHDPQRTGLPGLRHRRH